MNEDSFYMDQEDEDEVNLSSTDNQNIGGGCRDYAWGFLIFLLMVAVAFVANLLGFTS